MAPRIESAQASEGAAPFGAESTTSRSFCTAGSLHLWSLPVRKLRCDRSRAGETFSGMTGTKNNLFFGNLSTGVTRNTVTGLGQPEPEVTEVPLSVVSLARS